MCSRSHLVSGQHNGIRTRLGTEGPQRIWQGTPATTDVICTNNHRYIVPASLSSRAARSLPEQCYQCTTQQRITFDPNLTRSFPEIATQWNARLNAPLRSETVPALETQHKFWWTCPRTHTFYATVQSRIDDPQCPQCTGQEAIVLPPFVIGAPSQEIIDWWDYEKNRGVTPFTLIPGFHGRVYWKCPRGHSFKRSANLQTGALVCSTCRTQATEPATESLAFNARHTLPWWDYDANPAISPTFVSPQSLQKVVWKCPKNHSFERSIRVFVNSPYCPQCTPHNDGWAQGTLWD